MMLFNAVVIQALLYGATEWALTLTEVKGLDAFDMRMLRNIIELKWDDFVRNNHISERLCQRLASIKLRRASLKCFGHVERMGGR